MDRVELFQKVVYEYFTKPYLKHLSEHKDEDEKDFKNWEHEFRRLFEANHELVGRILKCHLIIEKYLNDCLRHYYGETSCFEEAGLRFHQKLTLLKKKTLLLRIFSEGFERINNIRNRLAHKLDARVTIEDVKVMKPFAVVPEPKPDDPISVIESFTTLACCLIADEISESGQRRWKHCADLGAEVDKILNSSL